MILCSRPRLCYRGLVSQTKELRSAPAGAGNRECDLRQTRIGFAAPGKAIGQHQDALHLSVPFASKHGAGPQVARASGQLDSTVSSVLGRHRPVEQPLAFAIEVAQEISLQPVGQHSEQQVPRQVRGRPSSEYGVPTAPKAAEVEVAQMRNLDLNSAQVEKRLDLRPGLLLPAT